MKVKVEGFRELEKALGELESRATRKSVARRALMKAGEPILAAYKAHTKIKSGALVESETMGTKLNRRQSRMNKKMGKAEVEIHIGTSDPAGIMEEFGLSDQAAHPALRPAWDSEGGETAVERIKDSLADEIVKASARQARKAAKAGT